MTAEEPSPNNRVVGLVRGVWDTHYHHECTCITCVGTRSVLDPEDLSLVNCISMKVLQADTHIRT